VALVTASKLASRSRQVSQSAPHWRSVRWRTPGSYSVSAAFPFTGPQDADDGSAWILGVSQKLVALSTVECLKRPGITQDWVR
jgi:hypothetical protein